MLERYRGKEEYNKKIKESRSDQNFTSQYAFTIPHIFCNSQPQKANKTIDDGPEN